MKTKLTNIYMDFLTNTASPAPKYNDLQYIFQPRCSDFRDV